jgi:hypothetical protein
MLIATMERLNFWFLLRVKGVVFVRGKGGLFERKLHFKEAGVLVLTSDGVG